MKRTLYWQEVYYYSRELEVPDGLSDQELVDWAQDNALYNPYEPLEPDRVQVDWDSFWWGDTK
jgi:hypothetical protein